MEVSKGKILLIVLSLVLVLLLGVKLYFATEYYNYEKEIEKMNAEWIKIQITSPVVHKKLDLGGCNIHYYVSGESNRDLILFLHPAFSDHSAFDQQIDFFSKEYKVITIDLIGHGLSKAGECKDKIDASSNHIKQLIEKEGHRKVHIVGVSMGTLIAQYFALNYPEYVESLTALGGYNINKEHKEVARFQTLHNLGLIVRAIFSMDAFRKKASSITCRSERGQAMIYETTSYFERKSFAVMQGLQKVVKDRSNISTNYPTLILIGDHDIDLAQKLSREWHAETNTSEFLKVSNAGHCANIDNPSDFNNIVKKFIKKNN